MKVKVSCLGKIVFTLENGEVSLYNVPENLDAEKLKNFILNKYGKYKNVTGKVYLINENGKNLWKFKNIIVKDLIC